KNSVHWRGLGRGAANHRQMAMAPGAGYTSLAWSGGRGRDAITCSEWPHMSASRNILHILDGAPRDDAVAPALARAGHRVMAAGIDGAWRWLAEHPCALILLGLDVPGLDSEEFLGQLRQRGLADSLSVVALISTDTPDRKSTRLNSSHVKI